MSMTLSERFPCSRFRHLNRIAMNRFSLLLSVLPFAAVSCGPLSYTMDVDMRDTSLSGLDLSKKTFSVVYVDSGDRTDSLFSAGVAEGFTEKLESEYFAGEKVVDMYMLDMDPEKDYSSRSTMLEVLMDTDSDVLFLIDAPVLGEASAAAPVRVMSGTSSPDSSYISEVSVPFSIKVNVFDSMDPADTVYSFHGANVAKPVAYTDGKEASDVLVRKAMDAIGQQGVEIGRQAALSFTSTWKTESHLVIYYESSKWIDAVYAASDYRWKDALDIWLNIVGTENPSKRSCAAYNIALACYMLGDYDLALEWLDRSDGELRLPFSMSLRKMIEARK